MTTRYGDEDEDSDEDYEEAGAGESGEETSTVSYLEEDAWSRGCLSSFSKTENTMGSEPIKTREGQTEEQNQKGGVVRCVHIYLYFFYTERSDVDGIISDFDDDWGSWTPTAIISISIRTIEYYY